MPESDLIPLAPRNDIAIAANQSAAGFVFDDYIRRKAANTVKNQRVDLASFATYLGEVGIATNADALQGEPRAWLNLSWGIIAGFVQWALKAGYSTGTISRRLSTIKSYAALALQAGAISADEFTRIRTVRAYVGKEADRIDQRRKDSDIPTRKGPKKAENVEFREEQAAALKDRPATPQGRRDRLLMCLLLDHGLRVGEVALLSLKSFSAKKGYMHFYRPKVNLWQTHKLSDDTRKALADYQANADTAKGASLFSEDMPLLRRSVRNKELYLRGYTERAIQHRVSAIGESIGLFDLSPHDCRHYWATKTAQMVEDGKISLLRLQEAGGWNSLNMPRRYVERAKISNKGIV